jgi:tetratricopeptide (TPR) repeat protein
MHYKAAAQPAPQVAAELNVDALVEGSIVREGDRLRVTVQLIDGPTDRHLWSQTYDRELASHLTLQHEVATAIAAEIRVTLNTVPPASTTAAEELNAELYQVYLRGRYLLHRRNRPDLEQALALFEQVNARAPGYAPAHAAVAAAWEALSTWGNHVRPIEGFPRVKAAAARALALDGSLAEAHTRLASASETIDLDLSAAEQGYRRAIELDPNSAEAHDRYARLLSRTGRPGLALEQARRAQQLDPFDFEINVEYAMRLADVGRHEEAIRHMRQTIDLDPTYYDPWVHLAYLYEAVDRTEEQVAAALRAVELSNRAPHAVHVLARTYARTGRLAEAQALADELDRGDDGRNALELGRLHLVLGQPARGLFWLQQACVERSVGLVYFQASYTEPLFDPVRDDPRFRQVLQCARVQTTP